MNRSKKILLAIYIALGFMLLRLVYAVVFSGLQGEQALISIPEIRLPRPFSHITLFGDVSLDGIARNLELAMPFAISIVVFGVIASFVSQQSLANAANRLPFMKNLLTALGIALASIPAIFEAGKKVAFANKIRGEKKAGMLVPILERSVEIANSLGLAMVFRNKVTDGQPGLEAVDLEIQDLKLGKLNLEVSPGEIVVLSGATGSGKTSVLEALVGILGEYRNRRVGGKVLFRGQEKKLSEIAGFVGYIPQNPRELLVGMSITELQKQIPEQLRKEFGLTNLPDSQVAVSEGEAFKLLFAAALARSPKILILDEPFAALDGDSRLEMQRRLSELAEQGVSVIIAEHEPEHTNNLRATRLKIEAGQIVPGVYQDEALPKYRDKAIVGSDLVLEASFRKLGVGKLLFESAELSMHQGECVWLTGPNGSGKSTLLAQIATSNLVKVHGLASNGVKSVALVPEHFDDFFVTDSLSLELGRADRIAKVPAGFTLATLESILPSGEIGQWLEYHPRDLSRGTRLALAIAMQLSHKPQVLLVDEPFRGLDPKARLQMVETLRCVLETGCAVLFASHEANWSEGIADRALEIVDKNLRQRKLVRT